MESKVIDAMRAFISSQDNALDRQISIDDGRFEDAMTCHFFFKMYVDEYFDIKESMTQDERNRLMAARTCLDYSYIYN